MNMNLSVEEIQKKALQYWYVDGLSELGTGFVFIFIGLTYWLGRTLQQPFAGLFLGFGQPIVQVGTMLVIYWLIRWAKQKVTYPRTGYLSYRRDKEQNSTRRRLLVLILAVIIAGITVFSLNFLIDNRIIQDSWITTFTAIFISGIFLFSNHKIHLIRLYILALYVLIIGIAFSLTGLPSSYINPFFLMLVGAGLLTTGTLTLNRYLHETQPADLTENL